MTQLNRTEDGIAYEDGVLRLRDGREMSWRWLGEPNDRPLLRMHGTPGSRVARNPDASAHLGLGVRYLLADRAGYGGSTRKPGRGIADIAADYAELIEHLELAPVPAIGTSGGGPHVLALAAGRPDLVSAVTVLVGATPLVDEEIAHLVGANARGYALAEQGWEPLYEYLRELRRRLLGGEGVQNVLSDAPATDRMIMSDPAWQRVTADTQAEALRQGAEGWTDEVMALHGGWDFDPADVKASVTWWHGDDDMNAPLSAARRVVAKLPNVDLRVWDNEGHFASLIHDREIVEELLSRA